MEQERKDHWHVRKEVNVGHMLTTLTLAAAAMWWAAGVEKRVAVLEVSTQQQYIVLEARLDRIEDKLDRLIQQRK